ncbi:MAG: DNA repair protein RecO [Dehalococcoidia bacterium]
MPAPRTYKTEALILKHIDLGEADRIITIYTPNRGKVRAVARGVRKTKSKLGGHVEPLTQCSLMLSRGRNLEVINQSQVIESFLPLHNDLQLTAQAMYLVELTDAFTSEHIENYPVYKLLLDALKHLSRTQRADLLFRYFEIQLLGYVGYRPELYECLHCRTPLEPIENFFSSSGGGVLCPSCAHTEPLVRTVSVDALKVLRLLQRGEYARASQLRIRGKLAREMEEILHEYVRYLLERELRSTGLIDLLKKDGIAARTLIGGI